MADVGRYNSAYEKLRKDTSGKPRLVPDDPRIDPGPDGEVDGNGDSGAKGGGKRPRKGDPKKS